MDTIKAAFQNPYVKGGAFIVAVLFIFGGWRQMLRGIQGD